MTTKHAANLPAQPFAEAFAVAFAAGAAAMRLKQQGVYRADAPPTFVPYCWNWGCGEAP